MASPIPDTLLGETNSRDRLTLPLADGGAINALAVVVDFGASFNQWAQTVVTGQDWVTADSKIIPTIRPAAGKEMETVLFNFRPVISNVVAGVGFTLSVFTDVRAKGQYTFDCIGA